VGGHLLSLYLRARITQLLQFSEPVHEVVAVAGMTHLPSSTAYAATVAVLYGFMYAYHSAVKYVK
jgi:hypothetical protein